MFAADPHCRRCGVEMWLPASGDSRINKRLTREQQNTMATIGHRYSKFDPKRYTEHARKKCYQLICYKCNFDEHLEESSKIPIQEQWARSNSYPQGHPLAAFNELNKYTKPPKTSDK